LRGKSVRVLVARKERTGTCCAKRAYGYLFERKGAYWIYNMVSIFRYIYMNVQLKMLQQVY